MSESHGHDHESEPEATFARWLDDGWQRFGAGDLDGARDALGRAQAIAESERAEAIAAEPAASELADVPTLALAETWALAGAIAAASGDVDGGLATLERATVSFPEEARYPLLAAEITLRYLEDADAAIELCDRALDAASEEEDLIDAVLLKAEALIGAGERDDEAREVLTELDGCAVDDPLLWCHAADLHHALGDLDAALHAYQAAIRLDPDHADAHHGAGMIHETKGDRAATTAAWLRTRELDLASPLEPWHLSVDEFEEIAAQAIAELPEDAQEHLGNVPVFIEDAPSEASVAKGADPRMLGLFAGTPLPHKSQLVDGAMPQIDSIHLYQRNLERAAQSRDELVDEIRTTVLHETAHFFGLEEDDLEEIGLD